MTGEWNYMMFSLTLKCPCNSDETSRKLAFELLSKEIKLLSPAYIHEVGKVIIVPVETLIKKKPEVCNVTDQRECGC